MASRKIINFAPGPAKLPEEVIDKAERELKCYGNTGMSVMEMSHRSSDFTKIINNAEANLRNLVDIPDNYRVIFLQGGGNGQFAAVPLNLMNRSQSKSADYLVTGAWSAKAAKEAEKYGKVNIVFPKVDKFTDIPDTTNWTFNSDASYVYYCANETIHGVEFHDIPETNGVPLVCDMSSNILSKHFDITKFALVYAGAQKNIGCAGVTLVIVREDMFGYAMPICPTIFDYKLQAGNNSCYNTPPTYNIYIMGLVFEWLLQQGGLDVMHERSKQKAKLVYSEIENSNGFYTSPVSEKARSCMNVPFRIGSPQPSEALEKKFVEEAQKLGMVQLKGHRSVGGLRVSIYNAITIEEVQKLIHFMRQFKQDNNN